MKLAFRVFRGHGTPSDVHLKVEAGVGFTRERSDSHTYLVVMVACTWQKQSGTACVQGTCMAEHTRTVCKNSVKFSF
jgi:hypothetical protein